ncbi:hypothetical protein [Methylobacillus sp. Pita1]|uniref:hypothetical protein n=1 Tax=Methylobacillus sp. Pita1 TaxID=3382642 RepID=UPI0038B48826
MKWIVIATDNAKRLFTLKAYSSGKYSVVETSENIPLNFHDAVFGDFHSAGFRSMETASGQKFLIEVKLADVGMVDALKTTLSNGVPARLKKISPGIIS